jgi:DNA end-binding protein Ku
MAKTDRAALGRVVMRAKEYLALVRARDGVLTLTTMRFADEVRPLDDIDAATQKSHKPTKKQLDAAVAVIEELSTEWKPEKYTDCHRERLQDVVNRKRKGQTIKAPKQEKAPDTPPDLMEALERTLAEIGGSA